ncbi:KH domain-containing protein, partial [Staphylococcus aureus]
ARRGRLEIRDIMQEEIAEPRPEVSDHAPRVEVIQIPTDKSGLLIGPGGKTINALQDEYGVNISVENDGTVYVAGVEGMSVKAAVSAIKGMTKE